MRLALAASAPAIWSPPLVSPPSDGVPQPCRHRLSTTRFSRPPPFPRPHVPAQPQRPLPVRPLLPFRQRPLLLRLSAPVLLPWPVRLASHHRPQAVFFPQRPSAPSRSPQCALLPTQSCSTVLWQGWHKTLLEIVQGRHSNPLSCQVAGRVRSRGVSRWSRQRASRNQRDVIAAKRSVHVRLLPIARVLQHFIPHKA